MFVILSLSGRYPFLFVFETGTLPFAYLSLFGFLVTKHDLKKISTVVGVLVASALVEETIIAHRRGVTCIDGWPGVSGVNSGHSAMLRHPASCPIGLEFREIGTMAQVAICGS